MLEDGRLETIFQLNVKGMIQFGSALVVTGIILAEADGTAGNLTAMFEGASSYKYFFPHLAQMIQTLSVCSQSESQIMLTSYCSRPMMTSPLSMMIESN